MKKRTLLIALLVIPMGIALARSEEAMLGTQSATVTTGDPSAESRLGTQSATVTTGGTSTEARLGTQSANVRQCRSEPVLGTSSVTRYVTVCDGDEVEATLGTQSGRVTTGGSGPSAEARLGTQAVNK